MVSEIDQTIFDLTVPEKKTGYLTGFDAISQQHHLERAAAYIQRLKERIEKLKHRKASCAADTECAREIDGAEKSGYKLPVIEVRHQEQQNLEVLLISGLKKNFFFHEVIGVLEEEGAEVVNASFSVVGNKIFHTIHTQAISSRIGLEASRVSARLQELIK
ncbi:hypothetical protein KSP39_PZI023592 [Platanthera zijinensis]|uniref:Uncharacterized protein n=1 Tax=Platanthera zijinensis TaxID=2320716 RepID=A0AAP0ASQ5_9ASPA